jgi:nicotinamide mononucleotide transporter
MMLIRILDVSGTVASFLATIFYIRASAFAWPISLLATLIGIVLYWQTGIYGDVGLHIVYLSMAAYGWWYWLYGGSKKTTRPVADITFKNMLLLCALGLAGFFFLAFGLRFYTNSQIPYLDAAATVLSLIAQWLTCRKVIQCWHVWFIVDSLFVGMYFYKGIPAHAALNLVYLGMAIAGYYNWKKMSETSTKISESLEVNL